MLHDVDHAASERRFEKIGVGKQQRTRTHPLCGGRDVVLWVFVRGHPTIMAPRDGVSGLNDDAA